LIDKLIKRLEEAELLRWETLMYLKLCGGLTAVLANRGKIRNGKIGVVVGSFLEKKGLPSLKTIYHPE